MVTGWAPYPVPQSPAAGSGDATVVYDTWDMGWWTLSSVPNGLAPASTTTLDWGLESPPMQGENHTTRLRSIITPEVSGEYRLYLSGDDDARLLFNRRNSNPRGARTVAYVAGWTEQYQWDRHTSQESRVFKLQAGRSYYVEAIGVHAFGLDHLEVGWSLNGGPIEVVPASVLSPTMLGGGGWRQSAANLPRRPDRPVELRVDRTPTDAIATWTAPDATDRFGPAEFYEVTLRQGRTVIETRIVEGTTTSFAELDTNRSYRIIVRSHNGGGRGRAAAVNARKITPSIDVQPVFECVDTTGGVDVAWFGYTNDSTLGGEPVAWERSAGNRNNIRPTSVSDVTVPTVFAPGNHTRVVGVELDDVARPDRLRWRLHRTTARIDLSVLCEPPVTVPSDAVPDAVPVDEPVSENDDEQSSDDESDTSEEPSDAEQPTEADESGETAESGEPGVVTYRVRNGDPERGEQASRVYIERRITPAYDDVDPDGDGWALVGRSNGHGESGAVANSWIAPDGTPVAAIRHSHKGCIEIVPPSLDPVRNGQTRIVDVRATDTATCRSQAPDADVDGDGVADDQQPLYRVRRGESERGENTSRYYIERSIVAAEAQLGVSDFDGDDGDGWAQVARTNGSGHWGSLLGVEIVDGVPHVVVDHPNKGCIVIVPSHLDTVMKGQSRFTANAESQALCAAPTGDA
mgnify:CR=1 FL=1